MRGAVSGMSLAGMGEANTTGVGALAGASGVCDGRIGVTGTPSSCFGFGRGFVWAAAGGPAAKVARATPSTKSRKGLAMPAF